MRKSLSARIKNLVRGGKSFWALRARIVGELLNSPTEEVEIGSSFLVASLLHLSVESNWTALKFNKADWPLLAKLQLVDSGSATEQNLIYLASLYAVTNLKRCADLARVDQQASQLVLDSQSEKIEALLADCDKIDQQSLFAFRLFAAANATVHSYIAQHFGEEAHASWVRQRFVYPLIYFTINRPSPEQLYTDLSSIFPWLETEPQERKLVRYLLRHDFDHSDSLSFKCYVALLSHPYDAMEMLTHHFEDAIAERRRLTPAERGALEALAGVNVNRRLSRLWSVVSGDAVKVEHGSAIDFGFDLIPDDHSFFSSFFDLNAHNAVPGRSKLLGALGRLRWSHYPQRPDFEAVVGLSGQYAFMSLGRILDVALVSIYMVSRRS